MIIPPADSLITSARLVLSPVRKSDYADWSRLRGASRSYLEPWEPRWPSDALSRSDWQRRMKAWQRAWRDGSGFVFLIRRIDNNELVGGVSLTQVRGWPVDTGSLGYWLGETYAGNGYMREAVEAVCHWAFKQVMLARIEAGIVPGNERSRRVLESAGFAEEGFARAYLEIAGERRDHILFGLVRSPDRR